MLWREPWIWVAGGIVLGLLEMLLPGFVLLGFAVGAVLVGLILWTGLIVLSLPMMLLTAALAAAVTWFIARRLAGVRAGQTRIWDRDINEN